MATTSTRGLIIKAVLAKFAAATAVFGAAVEMSQDEPQEVKKTIEDGKHFAELNFGDDEALDRSSAVTGVDPVEMMVVAMITLGGQPISGQSWSEYAADVAAVVYQFYADPNDSESHTWGGKAIDTSYAGGGAPFLMDGERVFMTAFKIKYRHTYSHPEIPR